MAYKGRLQAGAPEAKSAASKVTEHTVQLKQHNLAGYWSGIHNALYGRLLSVQEYLRHPSSGLNAENYFRDLLADYLPRRYAIQSGFVVNTAGDRSDFMDALVVDTLNIAPLSAEPHYKVFPAEAVVGAIEITSSPKSSVKRSGIKQKISKFADDVLKLARLREIARQREYIEFGPAASGKFSERRITYELSPRCFLITCGDEWSKPDSYQKHLRSGLEFASTQSGTVWVNAVLSMRHGMFHFRPHTPFSSNRITNNALLEFVLFLNKAVSEVPTARIDVTRYRPTTPTEAD
jgi:hypothetical protein